MALVSSYVLISALSLFHLTICYLLLVSPATLPSANLVLLLGSSMRIPPASYHFLMTTPGTSAYNSAASTVSSPASPSYPCTDALVAPNAATSLAAIVLALVALTDMVGLNMEEGIYVRYWATQVPIRLTAFFSLVAWIYLSSAGMLHSPSAKEQNSGFGSELKNSMVFTWGFIEVVTWFWIFSTLREERREYTRKETQRINERVRLEGL